MSRKIVPIALLLLAAASAAWWNSRREAARQVYTGFVEGEERLLRGEVSARANEVPFVEGDRVPAGAVVARLDTAGIDGQIASRRQEIAVIAADIASQKERVHIAETTWPTDVRARRAELDQALAAGRNAEQSLVREGELARTGASTAQQLDDARSRRDQAHAAVARARDILARAQAEGGNVDLARRQVETLERKRDLSRAQLAEIEVQRGKYEVRAPDVETVVQTRFVWPGELVQPGTPILSVLDPRDKYVQIYVPVEDVQRMRVGRRVRIELDSAPGVFIPGEIAFVADQANFTPEKIETRGDRLGQVYRAKVRILEGAERLQPGTEGNVTPVEGEPPA